MVIVAQFFKTGQIVYLDKFCICKLHLKKSFFLSFRGKKDTQALIPQLISDFHNEAYIDGYYYQHWQQLHKDSLLIL